VDIEEVAESNPDAIFKEKIDISIGVTDEQAARMAKNLGFTKGDEGKIAAEQFQKLYELFAKVRWSPPPSAIDPRMHTRAHTHTHSLFRSLSLSH
jgi:hypothetical protein